MTHQIRKSETNMNMPVQWGFNLLLFKVTYACLGHRQIIFDSGEPGKVSSGLKFQDRFVDDMETWMAELQELEGPLGKSARTPGLACMTGLY